MKAHSRLTRYIANKELFGKRDMKNLKYIFASLAAIALTGCFSEDWSTCPADFNVTINYVLPDADKGCVFLDHVYTTTTAVYNEEGELVHTEVTSPEHHMVFKGVRLSLPPGNYRVVSWGNTGAHTTHKNIEYNYKDDADALVTYSDMRADKIVGTSDEIYYGPNTVSMTRMGTGEGNQAGEYVMTVTEKGHNGVINFRHAHRRVDVYIKGFDSGTGMGNPLVQLTDLPSGLTFTGMHPIQGADAVTAELSSEMVEVGSDGEKGRFALASFNSFYFNLHDNDININIINPANHATIYTTRMQEHIDADSDDPDSQISLKLLIEFIEGADVKVSIPDWDLKDVDYGIF